MASFTPKQLALPSGASAGKGVPAGWEWEQNREGRRPPWTQGHPTMVGAKGREPREGEGFPKWGSY